MSRLSVLLALLLAATLLLGWGIRHRERERVAARRDLQALKAACSDMLEGSNVLAEHIRRFVLSNGSADERNAYFREAKCACHREKALGRIVNMKRFGSSVRCLNEAMEQSLLLMTKECHAMRLMTPDDQIALTQPEVREFRLTGEESCVTYEERCRRAQEEIFGEGYVAYRTRISRLISNALYLAGREVEK